MRAVAEIVAMGLPCVLHCETSGGFARLECTPQLGWIHLCNDAAWEREMSSRFRYHISVCRADTLDLDVWARICSRWHEKFVHVGVSNFSGGAFALLKWEGLGSDADLWELYLSGCWGYKWHENGHGLHVSM